MKFRTYITEATPIRLTTEDKNEIKTAIDKDSDPNAIEALIKTKILQRDPATKEQFKKLDEGTANIDLQDLIITDILNLCKDQDFSKSDIEAIIDYQLNTGSFDSAAVDRAAILTNICTNLNINK